jgi:hypothetical protein
MSTTSQGKKIMSEWFLAFCKVFSVFISFDDKMAEPENEVVIVDEKMDPIDQLHTTEQCLPNYDPSICWSKESPPFLYWKIRDYAYAYRSNATTPSIVCYLYVFIYNSFCLANQGA